MIIVVVVGIDLLVVMAIVVGIIDAMQTPALRRIAAQRRRDWEARQRELHDIDPDPFDTREDG
ncbi:MAG: hypothetical protein ACR2GH_06090 [Pseudonocardia sp.]